MLIVVISKADYTWMNILTECAKIAPPLLLPHMIGVEGEVMGIRPIAV